MLPLQVNGSAYKLNIDPETPLLWVLRDHLGLTVTKYSCGIAFGLSATLKGSITITEGQVDQSNFDDFPILRMDEMPIVEVHLVKSPDSPGGIGESAVPLIAPAVTNAILAATGKRIQKLPIDLEELLK